MAREDLIRLTEPTNNRVLEIPPQRLGRALVLAGADPKRLNDAGYIGACVASLGLTAVLELDSAILDVGRRFTREELIAGLHRRTVAGKRTTVVKRDANGDIEVASTRSVLHDFTDQELVDATIAAHIRATYRRPLLERSGFRPPSGSAPASRPKRRIGFQTWQ